MAGENFKPEVGGAMVCLAYTVEPPFSNLRVPPSTGQYSVKVLATFATCSDTRSLARGRHSDTRNGKHKRVFSFDFGQEIIYIIAEI